MEVVVEPGELAFFLSFAFFPEKRKHNGENQCMGYFGVRFCDWSKEFGIRPSPSCWLRKAPRVEAWKLISDLGDLMSWNTFDPLGQVPICCWKTQKSGINSAVEVEPLVVYPMIYWVLAPSQVVVWLGFLKHQEWRLRWHPSTVFTLFTDSFTLKWYCWWKKSCTTWDG